ncbi:hypothetical protein J4E86_008517 [Alternaria arbusti]|uniref:uncharacterized protein n=1 Tax=Alternaria arbusti TaxID=232088 RepID=UPI00221FDEB3|nr:uncharacterized protein J4E86_008517 [Alternaria arbusti]KAI4947999.1 hypothetical protein J4E86_008517 [Alternaria arbusti]
MRLVEDSDIILIEPMDETAAHALLHKKLRDKAKQSESNSDSNNDVAELAAAPDHMPFALVQTPAYFLTSFFDRQGIPEALLRSPSRTAGNDNFKDILTARDYSLVTVTEDAHTFGMHNLVQQVTRKWLESQKQFNK